MKESDIMKLFHTKTKKEKYYDISEIDKTKAVYRLIIGERSNGKTYACIEKVIKAYFKNGKPSAYVRRFKEELAPSNMQMLINPHNELIERLSSGKYNSTDFRTGAFWLTYKDDDGKILLRSKEPILYTAALSTWEKQKGQDRGEINYFIFDEFLTRTRYLQNEFNKFANCHSSFVRSREGVITYLIANTVNTYSIYWEEFGIYNIEKIKQGQIYFYEYNNKKLTLALEYCLHATSRAKVEYYYAFDNPSLDMIKTGEWEEDKYPHLENFSVDETTMIFKFFVHFERNIVVGEIHQDGPNLFIFFHPYGGSNYKIKDTDLVYTNHPTTNATWLHAFQYIPSYTKNLQETCRTIQWLMSTNQIFYSSNSVGEIIRNFILQTFSAKGG